MKLWIAKDEGSDFCKLFITEPYKSRDKLTKKHCWKTRDMWDTYMCLPSSEFTDVTYENSPRQVELNYVMNRL